MPVGVFSSPHVRSSGTRADVPVVAVSSRCTTQECSGCGYRVRDMPLHAHPQVSQLWPGTGLGLERRAHYVGRCPGGRGLSPNRRAGGNGFRFAGTKRFGTDRLYGCVRKGTRHSDWMNEASPGFSPGECQVQNPPQSLCRGSRPAFASRSDASGATDNCSVLTHFCRSSSVRRHTFLASTKSA
jgi:hypothetical protein